MTDGDSLNDELAAALADLNDADRAALLEMLEDSPDLLRQALQEYGYGTQSETTTDGLIVNESEDGLTDAQRELDTILSDELDTPVTVSEIVDLVGSEDASFRQKYSSAQYRPWVSEQLKALANQGRLGRYRDGRSVYYTKTPADAIRHWCRLNQRFVGDVSMTDAGQIKEETGMPRSVVNDALRTLTND